MKNKKQNKAKNIKINKEEKKEIKDKKITEEEKKSKERAKQKINQKNRKRIYTLAIICFILLMIFGLMNIKEQKTYFKEIKYDKVIEKMNNKDSFVLVLSQTTCSHCMEYKPKVESVANKYKLTIYYVETNLLNKEESEEFKKYITYSGTPTTVFIIDGAEKTVANRIDGSTEEQKIIDKLKSNGFID